jgi:hypothetical protein
VDVTTTGQLSFQVRYKKNYGASSDPTYQALLYAWLKKREIAMVDLDGPISQVGAQGTVGNYTITFTLNKPVEGVVLATVTAKLSSYPDRVTITDDDPLAFSAL